MKNALTRLLPGTSGIRNYSLRLLADYARDRNLAAPTFAGDPGVCVVARLLRERWPDDERVRRGTEAAFQRWLETIRQLPHYPGLFPGVAGMYAGCVIAADHWPAVSGVARAFEGKIAAYARRRGWRRERVSWTDYDLTLGPAGVALALSVAAPVRVDLLRRVVGHLVELCDPPQLRRLRLGVLAGDRIVGWNFGSINTGMAHGVAGILASLNFASGPLHSRSVLTAIRVLSDWLRTHARPEKGVTSWPPGVLSSFLDTPAAIIRKAWCYGNPGISWTLWKAGVTLTDTELKEFAVSAFSSYCRIIPEELKAVTPDSDGLAICHGLAGILLIADTFYRASGSDEARSARLQAMEALAGRWPEIVKLSLHDGSLLNGGLGIAAAALTAAGGDRRWLRLLGME